MNKTRYIITKRRHYISPTVTFEEMEGDGVLVPNTGDATAGGFVNGDGEGGNGAPAKSSVFEFDKTEDIEEFDFDLDF